MVKGSREVHGGGGTSILGLNRELAISGSHGVTQRSQLQKLWTPEDKSLQRPGEEAEETRQDRGLS